MAKYQTLLSQPQAQPMPIAMLPQLVDFISCPPAAVNMEVGRQQVTTKTSGFRLILEAGQRSRLWPHREDKIVING